MRRRGSQAASKGFGLSAWPAGVYALTPRDCRFGEKSRLRLRTCKACVPVTQPVGPERWQKTGVWRSGEVLAQRPKRASCALDSCPASSPQLPRVREEGAASPIRAHGEALTQGPFPPSGLLRLEELVRGFLISKETLSVRMLDDSRDPTPLLKEIRDDKVSTIIIDANASISHLILRKVGSSPSHL